MPDLTLDDVLIGLLVDVDAYRVADDPDEAAPYLHLDDGDRARVADMVWQMERDGLVVQPAGSLGWELTPAGRTFLGESSR